MSRIRNIFARAVIAAGFSGLIYLTYILTNATVAFWSFVFITFYLLMTVIDRITR